MNCKVLIPQLISPNRPSIWAKNAKDISQNLSFKNKKTIVFDKEVSGEGGKFARHSRARNEALAIGLTDDITHVFWIDSDVISYDFDIIEKLLSISKEHVIAPYVFIEDNEWWLYKRFYDITCFIDSNDKNFHFAPPRYNLSDGDQINKVNSVGTCFLIPAEIYKYVSYNPFDHRTEHVPFFESARNLGYKIYATPDIEVFHAFLPKYGEHFH